MVASPSSGGAPIAPRRDRTMDDTSASPASPGRPAQGGVGARAGRDDGQRIEPSPDHAEEDLAAVADDAVPTRSLSTHPLVGLGGSAGSIGALKEFFAAVPEESGYAYVVVVHLAPDHSSLLAEILQRSTRMPVRQVDETATVQTDHVYVIAPGKTLISADGSLVCGDLSPDRGRRVAVDLFFRTLADTYGPQATAIVLSGADGDGSIGIRRIKERGGLTIAQDPDEAEHDGMPRSAIATGVVDWILRVADMPARIAEYGGLRNRLVLPPEKKPAGPAGSAIDELDAAYESLLRYVRANTGRDFTSYKRATMLRRIARRMGVCGVSDLHDYVAFIRTHPGECGALLQDLLISVTNFFRDRDAFDALVGQIPALFEGKRAGDEVRVWVPACATGEEAYSIAMLLVEHVRTLDSPPGLQVFATDLDEDAIRIARNAVYPPAIAADLSEERLRKFFTREPLGYRIRTELREVIVFAVHDVLKDSPFSHLDLVSCRNLLIYLNRDAQLRVLRTLHFALRSTGRLFLGVSETVDSDDELFRPLDKKHRVYEPLPVREFRLPVPLGDGLLVRSLAQRRHKDEGGPLGVPQRDFRPPAQLVDSQATGFARELHLKLIERFASASIVVDSDHAIVHLSERAGRFLRYPAGEPTSQLLAAIDPQLVVDLRTALESVHGGQELVETAPIAYGRADESVVIRIATAPDLAPGYLLVTFPAAQHEATARRVPTPSEDANVRQLQQQVDQLKWRLREATEQGSETAQELKASNEELQAMNEELRSSGEELETSREELQSINEELSTINQELKVKLDELGRTNADLQNLMSGTAIPTVFLDRELRISLFTPTAVELFNLIAADVGRPLSDLANRLDYPQLDADARSVVDELRNVEREVRFGERWLLARLRPYRGVDDRINGVVLVFVDITERRRIAEALHESELLFRTIVTQAGAGVVRTDLDGRITLCNARFAQMVGVAPEALVGTSTFALVHPDDRERNVMAFRKMVDDGQPFEMEKRYLRADGTTVWVSAALTALIDGDGKPTAAVAIVIDVSERVHTQHALRESEERLRLVVDSAREYAIVTLDLKRRITGWNSGAEAMTGYLPGEAIGDSADIIFVEEDRAAGVPQREAQQALTEGRAADERWHQRKNGTRFWGSGVMTVMRDVEGGVPVGLLKIFRDRTHERASEQALETSRSELVQALVDNRRARAEAEAANLAKDRFLAILSHELRTPLTPIVMALHALERHPELPKSLRGTIEVLRRNVKAELTLIDDLLDVTRISSGKLEIANEQTDMHEVIEAAVEICAGDFTAKRQRLSVVLDAERHVVAGDSARLQQVIWNLLKNAAKFTADEGEVGVVTSNVGDHVVIVVADTGIGIGAEALSTIFDAFAQEGHWVTSEFGGLGLGLAIAKATVEAHHGTLAAASAGRGRGATFTIELPLD